MRATLYCVIIAVIYGGIRGQNYDFRPTPIPLDDWHHHRNSRRESRAGTLQETYETESPTSVAHVPAHYWEDALRHSVYLTLVKDKIKQLITKVDFESSDSKGGVYDSKEIEDQGLWNQIKSAPFKRLPLEERAGDDVTVVAKGRLLEDNKGFSFAEDEKSKETCNDDNCMRGVKAFWSVKRVRQGDHETSPGKYHYELTFSVVSPTPKKQKKPQENPIRTYTARENVPRRMPQEYRKFEAPKHQNRRPERAVWFHKNIAPDKQIGRRQYFQGFDKIFSSLFSDDEDSRGYEAPPTKYKQSPHLPPAYQYSKIGHGGIPSDHHHIPYPYRPNPNKQIRPLPPVPPIYPIHQSYQDVGSITTANSNLFSLYPYDQRADPKPVKTTRPAVLPTPLPPILSPRDYYAEVTQAISFENFDNATLAPDAVMNQVSHSKYKPNSVKANYFTDHVRPPVYNAPPGVFVTMDKKPFKPMPPLKYLHLSKPNKPQRPVDFRPSPQVVDVQFSDPDSFADTAFRPITVASIENNITTSVKKNENKIRTSTTNGKKPSKKHEITKAQHVSTAVPEIITAQPSTSEEIERLEWANILGAFTRTTPMVSHTEPVRVTETTTPVPTTVTTEPPKKISPTTEAIPHIITTTKGTPKKRTRPPPKFKKQEKIKKHKRITTTTSTAKTTTKAPENHKRKLTHDLTPHASSVTGTAKTLKVSNNKTQTSTTTTSTTAKPTTTTTEPSTTTTEKVVISSTPPETKTNRNRFRQSTLILKGTSVKHDRWNTGLKTSTSAPSSSSHRRKGSNFMGYISSTTPRMSVPEREKVHADQTSATSTSTETIVAMVTEATSQTNSLYEETVDQYETNSVVPLGSNEQNYDEITNESKEYSQYASAPSSSDEKHEKSSPTVQLKLTSEGHPKSKSKCKKKKQNTVTTEKPDDSDIEDLIEPITLMPPTARTAAEIPSPSDIEEILKFNDDDEKPSETTKADEEENDNYESHTKADDEFEDFFNLLDGEPKQTDHDTVYDNDDGSYEENDVDDDTEFDDENGDDENVSSRDSYDDETEHKRPFSFLELIGMS